VASLSGGRAIPVGGDVSGVVGGVVGGLVGGDVGGVVGGVVGGLVGGDVSGVVGGVVGGDVSGVFGGIEDDIGSTRISMFLYKLSTILCNLKLSFNSNIQLLSFINGGRDKEIS
jgi:hypothetical protein